MIKFKKLASHSKDTHSSPLLAHWVQDHHVPKMLECS